jgi:H(+)-translocating pyrophosphatase
MSVATKANVRTANAARTSQNAALGIAFSGGAVMGMTVTGLGLLGLGVLYLIFKEPSIVNGFALGGSSIALFGRVGGGIYTKAADVGADLVGKVEAGIPEDDPRNPATIADNVGDNVGDVAGMGADLFESYVGSIISAMTLGVVLVNTTSGMSIGPVILPMVIAAGGILASIIGTFFVRTDEKSNPLKALNAGTISSAIVLIIVAYFAVRYILPADMSNVFWALVAGLIAGTIIGFVTQYYTAAEYKPVQGIASAAQTGPATVIISGLGVGMLSTAIPILVICIAIVVAYIDSEGYLMITDRNKDAIKSGGEWISTLTLEDAISQFKPILECAVIGIPDDRWDERPCACIALKPGETATAEDVQAHLERFAAEGKIEKWWIPDLPNGYFFVDAIPHNYIGKIEKNVLRQMYAEKHK